MASFTAFSHSRGRLDLSVRVRSSQVLRINQRPRKRSRARTPPSKKGGHLRGEQVAQGFDGLEI